MAATEKSKANLKPPQKGEVRNPKGKPKGIKNRSTVLNEFMGCKMKKVNPITGKMETLTVEQHLELALIKQGIRGNTRAQTLMMEKRYGKVPLDLNLAGQQGNNEPIKMEMITQAEIKLIADTIKKDI